MEFKVEARSKRLLTYFNTIMPALIENLGLTNSRRAVLVKVTGDVEARSEGTTHYIEWCDCYVVMVRPPARWNAATVMATTNTLVHEMIHVRQLALGLLKFTPKGRIWRGKYYSSTTPYLSQPWEIDAFERTELTLRRTLEA